MLFNDTFIHHCEILPQGFKSCYSNYRNCKTNPGHKGFMPVETFKSELLNPFHEKFTFPEKDYIQLMIDSTVKITLDHTSTGRPAIFPRCKMRYPCIEYRGRRGVPRSGTGYLPFYDIKKVQGSSCPCHLCKTSDSPKQTYWEVPVSTATHVVFDNKEAKSALVELFYDSESKEGVRHLYGVNVYGEWDQRYNTDYCVLRCVTHEADLVGTLKRMMEQKKQFKGKHAPTGIMISHPHGMSKMVSLGCVEQKCFIPDSDTLLDSLLTNVSEIDVFWPKDEERATPSPAEKKNPASNVIQLDPNQLPNILPLPCDDPHAIWTREEAKPIVDFLIFKYRHDDKAALEIDRFLADVCNEEDILSFFTTKRFIGRQCDDKDKWALKYILKLMLKELMETNDKLRYLERHFCSDPIPYNAHAAVLALPGEMYAILPPNLLVQLRRHFFGDKCFWGTISPVTLVFTKEDNKVVQSELVFYVPVEAEEKISFNCFTSLSYSMPACPGCSGARVSAQFCPTDCDTDDLFGHNHHFGYDGEQSLSGRVSEGHMTLRDIKNNRIKIWI